MTAQSMTASAEHSPKIRRAGRKVAASLGLLAAGSGFVSLIALPIAGIGMRKDGEVAHAQKAHEDMLRAALAITGSTIIDNSTEKVVLLQQFSDQDTLAVRTGTPNTAKAHQLVAAAGRELQGTMINDKASRELTDMAHDPSLDAQTIIHGMSDIDTTITHGDVITGKDMLIETGVLGATVLGWYIWAGAGPIREPRVSDGD